MDAQEARYIVVCDQTDMEMADLVDAIGATRVVAAIAELAQSGKGAETANHFMLMSLVNYGAGCALRASLKRQQSLTNP